MDWGRAGRGLLSSAATEYAYSRFWWLRLAILEAIFFFGGLALIAAPLYAHPWLATLIIVVLGVSMVVISILGLYRVPRWIRLQGESLEIQPLVRRSERLPLAEFRWSTKRGQFGLITLKLTSGKTGHTYTVSSEARGFSDLLRQVQAHRPAEPDRVS